MHEFPIHAHEHQTVLPISADGCQTVRYCILVLRQDHPSTDTEAAERCEALAQPVTRGQMRTHFQRSPLKIGTCALGALSLAQSSLVGSVFSA